MNANIAKGNPQRGDGARVARWVLPTWPLLLAAVLGATAAQADLSGVPPVAATVAPSPPVVAAETAAAQPGDETSAPRPHPYALRLRLDDGRYRGFHQDSSDELRTDNRASVENDQIRDDHRARGRELYP